MGLASLLAASCLFLAVAPAAEAAFPGANGKIAFVSSRDDPDPPTCDLPPNRPGAHPCNFEIYTVNPDGAGVARLTNDPARDIWPAWSADGAKIAFASNRDGDYDIYVMNAVGTGLTQLTNDPGEDTKPSWSPSGSRLVFQSNRDGDQDIYTMNADGTDLVNLTNNSNLAQSEPDWSPGGGRIAFLNHVPSPGTPDGEVWTMNSDGTDQRRIAQETRAVGAPDWSPDGHWIAYSLEIEEENFCCSAILVRQDDGSSRSVLVRNDLEETPAWSPDGQRLAYFRWPSGEPCCQDIWILNADGTQTRLTPNSNIFDGFPDWQPQGPPAPPPFDAPHRASRLTVPLVSQLRETISVSQCRARGGSPSTHGAPLSFDSCHPPAYLLGTAAHMGDQDSGVVELRVSRNVPFTAADESDLVMTLHLGDIRNSIDDDYNVPGQDVTLFAKVRVSDTYNGATLSDPATARDFDYEVPVVCTNTPNDPTYGSICQLDTTADAVTPGAFVEGRRTVIQVFSAKVSDAGANAVRGDSDDRVFATQGLYVP